MSNSLIQNNGKFIQSNGKWIGNKLRYVYTTAENGVVYASPTSCYKDTEITLTNKPNEGYVLDNYSITGATLYDINKVKMGYENINVSANFKINYNPLNLPPYTIRIQLNDGDTPSSNQYKPSTFTQFSVSPNVWDCYCNNNNWDNLLARSCVRSILGANSTNITSMQSLTNGWYISSTELFDTSNLIVADSLFIHGRMSSLPNFDFHNVKSANSMFNDCINLKTIPKYNFSSVKSGYYMFAGAGCTAYPNLDFPNLEDAGSMFRENANLLELPNLTLSNKLKNVNSMFAYSRNITGGILRTYNQLSNIESITSHTYTFRYCGTNTSPGQAEQNQIPSDWK